MGDNCRTKYPVMLIHGCGFRDYKKPLYWGRIPSVLKSEGTSLFYGWQDAWGSIDTNAERLCGSVLDALRQSGSDKLNLIAHSKGGLDARRMIAMPGMADTAASLTTIATPHHGSKTMDFLCGMPGWMFSAASVPLNLWFRLLGDKRPDFCAVCTQLTTEGMREFNSRYPLNKAIPTHSYAGGMTRGRSDILMWFPYHVLRRFDGVNDGIVSAESAEWGEFRGVLKSASGRGISHLDEVDARRRRLTVKKTPGHVSDITEVYTDIVRELRDLGL